MYFPDSPTGIIVVPINMQMERRPGNMRRKIFFVTCMCAVSISSCALYARVVIEGTKRCEHIEKSSINVLRIYWTCVKRLTTPW